MKRLLIVLGLIGVVHISSGLNSSLTLLNPKKEINDNLNAELLSPLTPAFTEIDGNLFLAIQAEEVLNIEDGDVVEFVFGRKSRLISFHINDINQDLIDKGDAQLFVMVHQELALKLKSSRLKEVNIISNKNPYTIQINEFWVPDNYLTIL
jgi:hypothetical protein